MRVYGTGHDTTIDQPPTTPKENRSRNSRSHDQITRGGALIPHHHHAQPTNHTHSQTERKRKSAPRAEGTNSTYRPGRPSGDGQSERARSNPTTDGRRDSERSRNQHNAIYDRIYIILGVARPVGERKEEMDVRPPDFSWGGGGGFGMVRGYFRERPTRPRGWMSDIYAFYILSFLF